MYEEVLVVIDHSNGWESMLMLSEKVLCVSTYTMMIEDKKTMIFEWQKKLQVKKDLILRSTQLEFWISQSASKTRTDELVYLMHEESFLSDQKKGFDQSF